MSATIASYAAPPPTAEAMMEHLRLRGSIRALKDDSLRVFEIVASATRTFPWLICIGPKGVKPLQGNGYWSDREDLTLWLSYLLENGKVVSLVKNKRYRRAKSVLDKNPDATWV